MLITEQYRSEMERVHREHPEFGTNAGKKWAKHVSSWMTDEVTVLDYGCGKGGLVNRLGDGASGYDPGVEEWSEEPSPADLVVSFDVLEHVEPECISAVLDHIHALARRWFLGVVVMDKSLDRFSLSDGRNPHILIRDRMWWEGELCSRWAFVEMKPFGPGGRELAFLASNETLDGPPLRLFRSEPRWR